MSQSKETQSLKVDPIGKLLPRYSLPAICSMVIFSLYNIIDSIYIGHGVGAMAISGLAITFPIMNLSFAFGLLVGVGGASLCSIRLGQQDMNGAQKVLGNVVILSIINSVCMAAVLLFFLDPILIAFGASENTLPYARDFMQVILAGMPISYTTFNLNHMMPASGYPRKSLMTAVLTISCNVVLAPLFIFVFHWGIRGAATATILAQIAGLFWVLRHYSSPRSIVHFSRNIFKLRLNIAKSIIVVGMPPFLINMCACCVVMLINTGLMKYGGDMAVGAYGIINRLLILFGMIAVGLSQGMQPIVGYNHGARRHGRVVRTLKYCMAIGACITTIGFLISQLVPETIARMFTDDEELIAIAIHGLHMCTIAFPIVGTQIIIGNFFQAIGRAKISIFLALSRQMIFLIPALIILPMFLQQDGVWLSLPLADIVSTIVSALILMRYRREILRLKSRQGTMETV